MRCFWCNTDVQRLTVDHILPRSLGGTKEFSVQSCRQCQERISKAEWETARKSILAFHALSSPLRPRHPDRPTSGHLQPIYMLVKLPLGGYGESLLSAGDRVSSLPYIEVKFAGEQPIEARVRATSADDAKLLLETYRVAFRNKPRPNGLVCEFTANVELDPETAADPEFCPRIVLLPGKRLMVRARNPEEILRFAKALNMIAFSKYEIDPSKWNAPVQIVGGTPHALALRYDPRTVRRVAAKIGYALFCTVMKRRVEGIEDEQMRRYILGTEIFSSEPVSITPDRYPSTTSEDPHYTVLSPRHDRSAAFVSLYGFDFRVELGTAGVLPEPIIIVCKIDGSGMRIGSEAEVSGVKDRMETAEFSQPWLEGDQRDWTPTPGSQSPT